MAANNEVNIQLKATDKASSKLKTLEKNAGGLWSKLKKLGGPMKAIWVGLAATGVAAWVAGVKLFNLADSVETTVGKAQTVFGEYFNDMDKIATTTAKSMGLTRAEYLKTAAGMADLLKPMGFTSEQAADQTTKMINLAGALSEWSAWQYNAQEAGEILSKAMLWETEQLKSMWIAIDQSSQEYKKRIELLMADQWVSQQQARALDIQRQIFEKSTDAQKAYAEGADTLTRKKAEMSATLWNLKETIATALIPAFHEIVNTLQPVIEKVAENIKLWFENKENVEKLTTTIKTIIGVFWTLFEILGTVIGAFYKLGEGLGFAAFKVVEFTTGAYNKFIEFKDNTVDTFRAIKEFIVGIFEDMKNTIIEKFQAAIDFVNNALAKVKAVWNKITWLVSSVKSAASSVASGVSDFVTWTKANGGPVRAGESYMVWERGSEVFVPKTDGTIIPNGWIAGGVNINLGGVTVTNEADENRLAQKIQANLTETLQLYKLGIS